MKKGDWVQFRADWGKQPEIRQLGKITRIARDKSWADVKTAFGTKRIPEPEKHLRVVTETETIVIYLN